jgi:hypothetical protein
LYYGAFQHTGGVAGRELAEHSALAAICVAIFLIIGALASHHYFHQLTGSKVKADVNADTRGCQTVFSKKLVVIYLSSMGALTVILAIRHTLGAKPVGALIAVMVIYIIEWLHTYIVVNACRQVSG